MHNTYIYTYFICILYIYIFIFHWLEKGKKFSWYMLNVVTPAFSISSGVASVLSKVE